MMKAECSTIRTMTKIATIAIPIVKKDIAIIFSFLDELNHVVKIHNSVKNETDHNKLPVVSFDSFVPDQKSTRKRTISLGTLD